ncbi:MAG: threonylcarbamoyl-AMP synthase [archaeon]|nr:MAG: threonylcarbamoyl-AMP synthase [archaeon]
MNTQVLPFEVSCFPTAVGVFKRGGLFAFPTDTVYGLGCDPFDRAAVGSLFEAKQRDEKPIPVLCAGLAEALKLVSLRGAGAKLASKHWPGELTIIAPVRAPLPPLLHQGTGWLGVRVPKGETLGGLLTACGGYLTGTSANLSGQPSARSAEDVLAQLGDSIDLVLDGGRLLGLESTVVKASGDEIVVLRQGRVGVSDELKQP